jgi:erythrocyte band 7 integral membrane protein
VLTKDSVTVSVDAVVYFRVSNATVSVANVENAHHSTRLLAQTTLRNILGTKDLHEILGDRETISGSMQAVCAHITFDLPPIPHFTSSFYSKNNIYILLFHVL